MADEDSQNYTNGESIPWPRPMLPTLKFLRLRWQIKDGPLSQCVKVLEDPEDPESEQRPFLDEHGEYHEISKTPVSDPPAKQFTIEVAELHGHPNLDENLDWEVEEWDEEHPTLKVTSGNKEYISILQYIHQVHPWLLSLKDFYYDKWGRAATGQSLPPETELWVSPMQIKAIEFFDSISMGPLEKHWEYPARMASNLIHGTPEGDDMTEEEFLRFLEEKKRQDNGDES